MLEQATVDREEEALRLQVRALGERERELFYAKVKPRLRDPDTYAALNWFFITGIHHFYLGRWARGALDLLIFLLGVALLITGQLLLGLAVILAVSIFELYALFRSQIIIQDWNNRIYREELAKLTSSSSG